MGASFSVEDELFSTLQWCTLLTHCHSKEDIDPLFIESASSGSQKIFNETYSYYEWQAFLAALQGNEVELSEATATCSKRIADAIFPIGDNFSGLSTLSQLPVRCSMISLLVYIIAWWRGVIDAEEFMRHVDALEVYQNGLETVLSTVVAQDLAELWSTDEVDKLESVADDTEAFYGCEESEEVEVSHKSKRQRLIGAVRRLQHFAASASASHVKEASSSEEKQRGDGSAMVRASIQLIRVGIVSRLTYDNSDQEEPVALQPDRTCLKSMWENTGDNSVLLTCAAIVHAIHVIMNRCEGIFVDLAVKRLHELYVHLTKCEAQSGTSVYITACTKMLEELEKSLLVQQLSDLSATNMSDSIERHQLFSQTKAVQCNAPKVSLPESFDVRWQANREQYIGQEHIWDALREHFTSMDVLGEDAEKPTVVVLFGPSGLGKSELAKRLACALHGVTISSAESYGKLVHIHMPSFCTSDSIYSLVDPPAAHVGDGILLSALVAHPDAVVVLDEFEKSTTAAVQHLWLSAFQKNGMLRSLKNAARSVSTVKTTFVLTCNTAAEEINHHADTYLHATKSEKEALREQFISKCRSQITLLLGTPFVNRVDFFFPVIPYSREERERFVVLQLDHLVAGQASKGRAIAVTPSCINALVNRLSTFHAPTVELIVKPLFLKMVRNRWDYAVLAAVQRVTSPGVVIDLIPVKKVEELNSDAVLDYYPWQVNNHPMLDVWFASNLDEEEKGILSSTVPNRLAGRPSSFHKEEMSNTSHAGDASFNPQSQMVRATAKEMILESSKECELEASLCLLTEQLKEKDLEIEVLKARLVLLETGLELVLCLSLAPMLLLSLIIGFKAMICFTLISSAVLMVLLRIPLSIAWEVLTFFFSTLTPYRWFILGGCVILIWSQAFHWSTGCEG